MSSTDSDFDDEDLAAPPKKSQVKEIAGVKRENDIVSVDSDSAHDVQDLSRHEYQLSIERKQVNVFPKMDKYSLMVRRQQHNQGSGRKRTN